MLIDNWVLSIIGAITGTVSLGILIYKTWREKPQLSIVIQKAWWYIHTPEDPTFNMIIIPVRIDNTGSNGTTVYSIQLDFHNNDKSHTTPIIPDMTIEIPPHSTIKKDLSFTLTRRVMQLENELTNVKVIFNYTHGQKQIEIPNIKQTTL